jgi:hypothetical protein
LASRAAHPALVRCARRRFGPIFPRQYR